MPAADDARRQKGEPTSLQHGEIAQQHVVTVLQYNRLVGNSRAVGARQILVRAEATADAPETAARTSRARSNATR